MFKELATWNFKLISFYNLRLFDTFFPVFSWSRIKLKITKQWCVWISPGNSSFSSFSRRQQKNSPFLDHRIVHHRHGRFNDPAWFLHFMRGNRRNSIDNFLCDWKLIYEKIELSNYDVFFLPHFYYFGCFKSRRITQHKLICIHSLAIINIFRWI